MYILNHIVGGKPLFSNIVSVRDVQSREVACAMMVHMWVWAIDIAYTCTAIFCGRVARVTLLVPVRPEQQYPYRYISYLIKS